MSDRLWDWESEFELKWLKVKPERRKNPGALLSIIPSPNQWLDFLDEVRTRWPATSGFQVYEKAHCLIVLYGGVAFYEYDDGSFWPHFARAVGCTSLNPNLQKEINIYFEKAVKKLGLSILSHGGGTGCVESTIYHVGIPLRLWSDFLEICEWTQFRENFSSMSSEEWDEAVTKHSGMRKCLKRFLIDNREAADKFIREMHDARRILSEDESLSINDLKQICILRQEYLEVPETADFLRPANPESLLKNRARLLWDEQQYSFRLNLPSVLPSKLPAVWSINNLTQDAASTADTIDLNSAAFKESIFVTLKSSQYIETQRIRGIGEWGLFDLERNKFVNPSHSQFPIGSYVLLSLEKLSDLSREGFDEEENPANDSLELKDGTVCYATRLWPKESTAKVGFIHGGKEKKINFCSGLKIEARIYGGEGSYSTNFFPDKDWLKVERLPLLCITVPFGFFEDTENTLKSKFQVYVNEQLMVGIWEKRREDKEQEFYFWRWFNEAQSRKKVNLTIKSQEFGINFEYKVEILQPKDCMSECWQNLPGKFLTMCLLAQSDIGKKEGMKWQDLLLAKEAIAPNGFFNRNQLYEYSNRGLIHHRGHSWMIAESRAKFEPLETGDIQMSYCGDPTILWRLFRYLHDKVPGYPLPKIEVIKNSDELPYLLIRWNEEQQKYAAKYLENNEEQYNIRVVPDLWRP